ncbi:MAG: TetR family transcriptional regulator [Rhodospirillaceae bacterium]|jgi:AcrR family transcriptional regulator|nr:TetR family transcriptional regulator [Rhodospirillaceae bacterium]MBT5459916.1 TetR family transcriptional regulator [Rhodospirillaceae bacterium]
MAKRPRPVRDRIIDAALDLAGDRPWRNVGLGDIAAAAKQPLGKLHEQFPSKTAIVMAVMERTNAAMLADADPSVDEPPHDRLLDVMMQRLDALAPHKAAIRSILHDLPFDPVSTLSMAPGFLASMAWTLEAAGLPAAGFRGALRTKGLAAIYLGALSVWLGDDSEDQGKTLAFLDRRLKQAERAARFLNGAGLKGRHKPTDDESA